ncbi:MAG TPA: fumarylacetoacetate hydrolase family protein [Flavobacterium sp.]|nr:fumarylacetoacetate hydrolase family protein [Flavobacterium sp.]
MKIICIGRNYVEHISELENERPEEPVIFLKPDTAVLSKTADFYIPAFSDDVHHEIELVIKIDKVGKYIDVKFAHKYYSEITVGIDFTARDLQKKLKDKGLPWEKAKAFDGSAVVGAFIPVSALNVDDLNFELLKNGNSQQKGNTKQMLWKVDELIAYASQFFTLKKGDLIFTGTPSGVSKVIAEDTLEGKLEGQSLFKVNVK